MTSPRPTRVAGAFLAGVSLAAAPGPAPDRVGDALLRELHARVLGGPFHAVADLTVVRPGIRRTVLVRFFVRDPACALARVEGSPREEGTTLLRCDGRARLFLPRTDLLLDLPPSVGVDRLFGSDFAADDLLALGGAPEAFAASFEGEETVDGVRARRLRLTPRTGSASLHGEVRLWIAVESGAPSRMEFRSDRGRLLRVVTAEPGSRSPLPARWRAVTVGTEARESLLEFRFLERNPPLPADFFTIERVRGWR